jgi:hypothetical protein
MNQQTIIINSKNLESSYYNSYYKHLFSFLLDLESEYRGFRKWYFTTVFKGIIAGEREIIIKRLYNEILGIAILKNDLFEKKVCTLRVNEKYKGLGIGEELLKQSIDHLNEDYPLITVSSKHICEFTHLLNNFNFKLFKIYTSFYFPGVDEYSFNAALEKSRMINESVPVI